MTNYMLSIYIATYNHENYIKKALDSVFQQKTQYSFEVLGGEDCSSDNTRLVLKNYEKEHPSYVNSGKLKVFYRKHNMNKEIPSNSDDLKARCKGKYIIALEGDDYWTDDLKIESQINFLEKHLNYIAVAHNCQIVDENGDKTQEEYPECRQEEYTISHYMSEILPGQLTTLMYRNIYKDKNIDCSLLKKGLSPGDRLISLVLLCNGNIYCIQKSMSAYRHVTAHGDSYSATYRYKFKEDEQWNKAIVEYLKNQGSLMAKYGEVLYFRCIMKGIKSKQCTIKKAVTLIGCLDYKFYDLQKWIIYKWNKDILHRKIWI